MAINSTTEIFGKVPSNEIKKGNISKKRKIYGFAFPLGSTNQKGYFNKQSGRKLLRSNLSQLLKTERGERIMLPTYGISLKKYLFEPLDEITFTSIKNEILETISRYATNVQLLRLSVRPIDEYGQQGLQALTVKLHLKLKEEDNATVEVDVDIK